MAILRKKTYNQEELVVRAVYPALFEPIAEVSDLDSPTEKDVRKCFKKLCSAIRDETADLAVTLPQKKSGRPSKEESAMRDHLRLLTYILVKDFEGLRWWPHIEPVIHRGTPGRRPDSDSAKRFTDVLWHITGFDQGEAAIPLSSDALSDMANQLAYASKHDVPFQFLIGFLMQVGLENAAANERKKSYEPWYQGFKQKAAATQMKGRAEGAKRPKVGLNAKVAAKAPRTGPVKKRKKAKPQVKDNRDPIW